MKLSSHADRTEQLAGIRAEEIHRWIDGFFDAEGFRQFLETGRRRGFKPYNHRKYRHCAEALDDAYREFEGRYTREQIRAVFECHLRDDYDGFIPLQEDFESGRFAEKYHETDVSEELEKILSEAELAEYFGAKGPPASRERKISPGFYWRILWPTVLAAVLFAASAFTVIIPLFRNSMMNQKKQMIRELTSTAASAIEFYVHQEQSGAMTRPEAQSLAAAEVSELRYGMDDKDYFWITDMQPNMIMHPYRPELVGRDLSTYTDREDKSGKRLFAESVALVEAKGEGYLEYLWQWMDDPGRAEPKLSYVRGIPEWNWVIGTGIYIHDVEQEIARLTRHLLWADGIIAVVLFGLLATVVLQSRRIEIDRAYAESGLREAKERYRALVEGSREGYLLEVDGETVYSNPTLQRMTGYNEAALAGMKAWELLDPEAKINAPVVKHLQAIYEHAAPSAEFEACIRTADGKPLDVQVATSRIFFSEKNGHVISFAAISRNRQEVLDAFHAEGSEVEGLHAEALLRAINQADTPGGVVRALKVLPGMVRTLTDQGARPGVLRGTLGNMYEASVRRFVEFALREKGEAPVPFAFLSLGSNARHEMTLFSDQDNALVFADVPAERLPETRRALLDVADEVCVRLRQAGYPFCRGGVMAANPKWCLSLSEWKKRFSGWIGEASPQHIREINVFFDIRCSYGDTGLVEQLQHHVTERTQRHPEFFVFYAKDCLSYKAPLGLLGRIRAEKKGGEKTIHLKECLKPLETFGRIYALKHAIPQPGTAERLRALRKAEVLQEETADELMYVLEHLWQLRFYNQLETEADLKAEADELDITALTDLEREHLQAVLSRIPVFQSRLSYDFLGGQV